MLFEELMMDSSTLTKFQIYKKISSLTQKHFSIAQLAQQFDLSYQQTLIILNEMNHEIMDYSKEQPSIIKKGGKLNPVLTVSVDEYRYLLLNKSIPFLFILHILNHDQPTLENFCSKYYVSQSTVSRKMKALKAHVKQFQLRFSSREANLIGDERIVRLALFNSLWLGTRGIIWPFKRITRAEAEAMVESFAEYFPLKKTYLGIHELAYFAAIFISREKRKMFVAYDKRYDFLMKDNPYYDFKRLNKVLGPLRTLPPEIHKAESSFIFFLSHYAPCHTLAEEPSLQHTLINFSRQENEVSRFVEDFLQYIETEFFQDSPDTIRSPLIKGNLLNTFFIFHVLQQPFPSLHILVSPTKEEKLQVEDYLEQKIKEFVLTQAETETYSYLQHVQPNLTKSLKNILLPYCSHLQYSKKLTVGIAFENNFSIAGTLYQFLNQLGFVKAAPYIDDLTTEYDLVISSSLLPLQTYPDLPIHMMDLSYGDEELAALFIRLHQLFKTKNIIFDH